MKGFLACLLLLAAPLHAEERPVFYPFDVTLGGTKAEMKEGNELFAEVSKPVASDAVLLLKKEVPVLIVNLFACTEDGSFNVSLPSAIIIAKQVKEVKLDATMDKKKLPPGTYFASIEADGMDLCMVFTIGAPDGKPKVDFSTILEFLKKAGGE